MGKTEHIRVSNKVHGWCFTHSALAGLWLYRAGSDEGALQVSGCTGRALMRELCTPIYKTPGYLSLWARQYRRPTPHPGSAMCLLPMPDLVRQVNWFLQDRSKLSPANICWINAGQAAAPGKQLEVHKPWEFFKEAFLFPCQTGLAQSEE